MQFNNKVVVITGGANGIGAACAQAFHKAGASVAVLDKAEVDVSDSERWFFQQCDVSKAAEVEQVMQAIKQRYGTIHFLVNNAGIQRYGSVTETTEDLWNEVMNINLKSYFLCAKYALPCIQQAGGGAIINISSVQAFVTQENVAAYAASKSAILGLTRSIAIDYAPNIRCVAVCPGTIDTPMLHHAINLSLDPAAVLQDCEDMHLVKRIGKSEEIAALIKFLCSDESAFITGEAIRIDGGLGIKIGGSKKD